MARVPSDEQQEVTEVSVEVDTSSIAEITVPAGQLGGSPSLAEITVPAARSTPADNEPSTLEPKMSVRGLGPSTAKLAEADVEDDEDPTEKSTVESKLIEAYAAEQRARRESTAAFGPIITPSDSFRPIGPAPKIAPGLSPPTLASAGLSPAELEAADDALFDEDTVTDAMREALKDARLGDVIATCRTSTLIHDEDDETKTRRTVAIAVGVPGASPIGGGRHGSTLPIVGGAAIPGTRPIPGTMPIAGGESAEDRAERERVDRNAAAGGTVRMVVNAFAETALDDRAPPIPAAGAPPPPPPPAPVPLLHTPDASRPTLGPPIASIAAAAPTARAPRGGAKPPTVAVPRRRGRGGRIFALFFFLTVASAAGVMYYRKWPRPWGPEVARLLGNNRSSETTVATVASDAPSAAASSVPATPPSAAPSASVAAPASAPPPASAALVPSASASGGRRKPPRSGR